MAIDIKELKDFVYQRFKQSESKPLRSYHKDTNIKEKMEKALESEFFLTLLLFNNDKFNIAGNYTFTAMYLDEDVELNKFQKSIVGAFIRFIFEYLGYEEYTRTELNKMNLRWGRLYRKVDCDV